MHIPGPLDQSWRKPAPALAIAVLFCALLAGCGGTGGRGGFSTATVLIKLTIAPNGLTIQAGQTRQCAAEGIDQFGAPVQPAVAWSVTGAIGTIDGDGRFTATTNTSAGSPATGEVVARAGNVEASVDVTVTVGDVDSLQIEHPQGVDLANLPIADTVQFSATAIARQANVGAQSTPISITPEWRVTGGVGVIDGSGLFTPWRLGSGTVVATVSDGEAAVEITVIEGELETPDWTDYTHGKGTPPDYDEVFADYEVKRIDLTIAPDDWQRMIDNMTDNYGPFASGGVAPPSAGTVEPPYVPCSFRYNGIEWYKVGVRFKGHYTLTKPWVRGIMKLPMKFDFDEFEDDYPQINNQRFYGFKKLKMQNNYDDPSMLRERVVPEIFREAGVPAPYTTFCQLYVDHGYGPIYFGMYTMVEDVTNTVIKTQFDDDVGNLYEAEGEAGSLAEGMRGLIPESFQKKTNKGEADWSDVEALYDALHSVERTTDPAAWRANLEAVLDVDVFLRWLATNTVIQNWDTYGNMPHNYYLYDDPTDSLLTWIPWDNNEALQDGRQGRAVSLALTEVTNAWPLIRYLMDDGTYKARYVALVEEVRTGPFEPSKMSARYQELNALAGPYVIGAEGEISGYTFLGSPGEFDSELGFLLDHVNQRNAEAAAYVQSQQ